MINKIKKDRYAKRDKKTFLQKLYDKKRIFYFLITLLEQIIDKIQKELEIREEFRNVFYWANKLESDFFIMTVGYQTELVQRFSDKKILQETLERLNKEKNQKKLSYRILTIPGVEFYNWYTTHVSDILICYKNDFDEVPNFYIIERFW